MWVSDKWVQDLVVVGVLVSQMVYLSWRVPSRAVRLWALFGLSLIAVVAQAVEPGLALLLGVVTAFAIFGVSTAVQSDVHRTRRLVVPVAFHMPWVLAVLALFLYAGTVVELRVHHAYQKYVTTLSAIERPVFARLRMNELQLERMLLASHLPTARETANLRYNLREPLPSVPARWDAMVPWFDRIGSRLQAVTQAFNSQSTAVGAYAPQATRSLRCKHGPSDICAAVQHEYSSLLKLRTQFVNDFARAAAVARRVNFWLPLPTWFGDLGNFFAVSTSVLTALVIALAFAQRVASEPANQILATGLPLAVIGIGAGAVGLLPSLPLGVSAVALGLVIVGLIRALATLGVIVTGAWQAVATPDTPALSQNRLRGP